MAGVEELLDSVRGRPLESLADVRVGIDTLDRLLVPLLVFRFWYVESAAQFKKTRASVAAPTRAASVIGAAAEQASECGASAEVVDAIADLYTSLVNHGIDLEALAFHAGDTTKPEIGVTRGREHLRHLIHTTRAVRRYRPDPVDDELLEELIDAALCGPTGANEQGCGYIVVTDREQLARIAPIWRAACDFYLAALAARPVDSSAPAANGRVVAAMRDQAEHFEDVPALVVVCHPQYRFWRRLIINWRRTGRALRTLGPLRALRMVRGVRRWDRSAAAGSVFPGVQNLLLTARAHGLGAVMTTWTTGFDGELRTILDIPAGHDIHAIVPIGYPRGGFGPVRRSPVSSVIHRDRWRVDAPN